MNETGLDISIKPIDTKQVFSVEELQSRFIVMRLNKYSKCYCVKNFKNEAALLVIDRLPDKTNFVLYELFVLAKFRRLGIGSFVLNYIEDVARNEGYNCIKLTPFPLDKDISKMQLNKWYEDKGFQKNTNILGELYKKL